MCIIDNQIAKLRKQTSQITEEIQRLTKWKSNIKAKKKQEVDQTWNKEQNNKTATKRAEREKDQPAEN